MEFYVSEYGRSSALDIVSPGYVPENAVLDTSFGDA